jgi:site-specific DNA-methyltransferase (adenine-specific)
LLERIIKAVAKKDSIVLDPFCGCGTTISACENLNKNDGYSLTWLGIDVTHLAINLIKGRLYGEYNLDYRKDYKVIGEPKDSEGAIALSEQDRYQFQWWALSLINARPHGDKKKGADKGIDGVIYFIDYTENKTEKAIVQVKSGKVKSGDIRDLKGVVEREEASFGIFITVSEPTKDMTEEAVSSGFWKNRTEFPKIQILTIDSILNGNKARIPYQVYHSKEAERIGKKDSTGRLF